VQAVLDKGFPNLKRIVSYDGEKHLLYRRALEPLFDGKQLTALEPTIRAIASRLIDGFFSQKHCEIVSQFCNPLTLEVVLTMVGIPLEDMALGIQGSNAWVGLISSVNAPLEDQLRFAQMYVDYQLYLAQLLEERSHQPVRTDLISVLLSLREPLATTFHLTEREILSELVNNLHGFVHAGYKTAASTLAAGLYSLLKSGYWQTLLEQPQRIGCAVEEILRWVSALQVSERTTTREVTLGNVTLPANTRLLVAFSLANQDEEVFPQADTLDFARHPNRHVTFGYGPHMCLGSALARRELAIGYRTLIEKIPSLRAMSGQAALEWVETFRYNIVERFYVEW
jgi:cytochrome P450